MAVRFVCTSWSCDVPDGWVLDWEDGIGSMYDPDADGVLTISTYRKDGELELADLEDLVSEIEGRRADPEAHETVAFPLGLHVEAHEEGEPVHHWLKAHEDLLVYAAFHGDAESLVHVEAVVTSLVGYPERARAAEEAAGDA